MILTALFAVAAGPNLLQAHIVATSMFKNGYAVVLREIKIPGPGTYSLSQFPNASLGTLWFSTSAGTTIDRLKTQTVWTTSKGDIGSLNEVIAANVGRSVTLVLNTNQSLRGKIESASGDIVVLSQGGGNVVLSKASITRVESSAPLVHTQLSPNAQRMLVFDMGGKPGWVSMISLERGLTWVPGYAVDITDKKKLMITAKSTVLNDLENLSGVDARFVTGFPNVPFAGIVDPLVSGQNVDAFLGFLQSPAGFSAGAQSRGGGGGFGGGARMMTQNAASMQDDLRMVPGSGMGTSPFAGEQVEDLFFYKQPNVSLDRGEKAYYTLFRAEAPYKEVYTWDIPNPVVNNVQYQNPGDNPQPQDVWHTLEFQNTSGQPFTTAVATTFKGGQILGQDMINYVSAGSTAELKVTKALDIRAESSEEEVSRDRGAIKYSNNQPMYDLVTMRGTLQVTNRKSESVTLRIRHDFTGELVSADGSPDMKKTAKGLTEMNPSGRLAWKPTVEAGQSLTLSYSYKIYVRD
jgi:hypothetical protein